MKHLFLVAFFISASSVAAPNILIVEKSDARGLQQSSLKLEGSRLRYATNSNFTQTSRREFHLGLFHRETDPALRKEFESLLASVALSASPGSGKKKKNELQHLIRVKADGKEAAAGSEAYKEALAFMARMDALKDWTAEDAVEVNVSSGKPEISPLHAKSASGFACESGERTSFCKIKHYGFIEYERKTE